VWWGGFGCGGGLDVGVGGRGVSWMLFGGFGRGVVVWGVGRGGGWGGWVGWEGVGVASQRKLKTV